MQTGKMCVRPLGNHLFGLETISSTLGIQFVRPLGNHLFDLCEISGKQFVWEPQENHLFNYVRGAKPGGEATAGG